MSTAAERELLVKNGERKKSVRLPAIAQEKRTFVQNRIEEHC